MLAVRTLLFFLPLGVVQSQLQYGNRSTLEKLAKEAQAASSKRERAHFVVAAS